MSDVDQAKAHFFAALDLLDAKQYAAAEPRLRAALAIVPDRPSALANLAAALFGQDKIAEAIEVARRAVALAPDSIEAWLVLGSSLSRLGVVGDALDAMTHAVQLEPQNPKTLMGRATVLTAQKRFDLAVNDYRAAARLNPEEEDLTGLLVAAQMQACDWTDLHALTAHLLAGIRSGTKLVNPFILLPLPATPADQLAAARAVMVRDYPMMPPLAAGMRYDHERIRVAYVSGDFRNHPLAYVMAGVLDHHDHVRLETFGVSYGSSDGSALRDRVAGAFDHFIDVRGQSDGAVADGMRANEIDIAVDLGGYTDGGRPRIFMFRPAPVQVNYLGFPGTSGSPVIDYILADERVVPAESRRFYSEQVVWLPETYYPADNRLTIAGKAPSRVEAGLPEAGFVFCSFNSHYKITPTLFDIWMRLLSAVEGSVLWLLQSSEASPGNLRREAMARGIAAERLIFAPKLPPAEHLARHRLADLFLDATPCNAHTTATDALWAGLPLVTCPSDTLAGRVAGSVLHAISLPELIADSLHDYEQLALALALDPTRLAALKAKLAANRDTTALFNTARLTRHLEAAYATMMELHNSGQPPMAFAVPPIN